MRRILVLLALIAILPFQAFAEESENLLYNPDFSEISSSGDPAGWYTDVWYTDPSISSFGTEENGYEGSCAWVFNSEENDARWTQTLWVRPNTIYRLSGMIKAQSVGESGIGANLSFKETFVYSQNVYNTDGDWVYVEVYGKTGAEQTNLTVFLRVGGYGNLNYGRAWFDNIELVELSEAPEGAEVWDLEPYDSGESVVLDDTAATAAPTRHTEAFLLAAFAFVLIALGMFNKSRRNESLSKQDPFKWQIAFLLALAAGLVLRLFLAATIRGYSSDVSCFEGWSERIFSVGPGNFYSEDYFCDYPPGYMLLLWPIALLRSMFGIGVDSTAHVVLIKLIPILFDLAGAMLAYRFAKKRLGERSAFFLGLFFLFNPAIFVDSAAWGQIDTVFTLFIVLSALAACERRYLLSLPLFAAAMLIKPQAMLFAPLGLAAIAVSIATVELPSTKKPEKRRFYLHEQHFSLLLKALGGIGAALILMYLVALPFSDGGIFGPVKLLWERYTTAVSGYKNITINSLNLYQLLDKNWVDLEQVPALTTLAWTLFVLSYLYSIFLLCFSRDRYKVFLTGGLLITLIFAFGPMMHERYLFPAILLLTLAYAECRDKRIMWSLIALSATLFLNEALVLQGALDSATTAQYGHLQSSERWANVLLSLVNVLNALWLSCASWDICIRKKTWVLQPSQSSPLPAPDYRLGLKRLDALLIAAVTVIYSVVAFVNLGTTNAPQTSWVSSAAGQQAVFDLGEERTFRMTYYGGINRNAFTVEISSDGETWSDAYTALYDAGQIFRWLWFSPSAEDLTVSADTLGTIGN